jgi:hypothetical protein
MARDLAAMGQQIEALKASIAELKANQQAMARDAAKAPDAEGSEVKAPDSKPVAQAARPKPPVPPRAQAALPRRPVPAYYAPATAAPPPQQLTPSASWQAAPSPPPAAQYDGDDPVVRPPMALR